MTNDGRKSNRKAAAPLAIILAVSVVSGSAMAFGETAAAFLGGAPVIGSGQQGHDDPATGADADSGSAFSASPGAPSASESASASGIVADDVLGECSVSSQSRDEDRAKNLACAVKSLDGTVMQPGETLSLNDVLGDLDAASGYRIASESADGHSGASLGGGVCQVAAALYGAAVRADLDIVERHAHEEACDYVPAGFDAEVVSGKKDLKLRNASDEPVLIHATSQGQMVQVKVMGTARDDGKSFDITASIVDGGDGSAYTVQTDKVEFVDGLAQSHEMLFYDTYRDNATGFIMEKGAVAPTK